MMHEEKGMKNNKLAGRIFAALILGVGVGLLCYFNGAAGFTTTYLRPLGTIVVNLLKFIVVPIVVVSIIDGIVSMGDLRKVGTVGFKTLAYFLVTTAIACVIGLLCAEVFYRQGWFPMLANTAGELKANTQSSAIDTLVNIFPSNFMDPLMKSNMLQVIVISIFVGGGILAAGKKAEAFKDVVISFYAVVEKIMAFVIAISPIGVFGMIAWVVAVQGPNVIGGLAAVILCAYIGYIIHMVVIYSLSTQIFAGVSPVTFFRKSMSAIIFAFTSASSVATLPISKEACNELNVDDGISSFVLPLGATVNMDGTAIYQCCAAVFIAACCGIELTLGQMAVIVATSTLASIGTAGTPGAGTIMLAMVLTALGIDINMIMIIYGVDRIFDMGRTTLNIVGDISCAVCVDHWEGKKAGRK